MEKYIPSKETQEDLDRMAQKARLQDFISAKKEDERSKKEWEEYYKMENECHQYRDEAINQSKIVIKSAQETVEAFYVVVGYVEEKNYEAAYYQWHHIEEELLQSLNNLGAKFSSLSQTAKQKYSHLNTLAPYFMSEERVREENIVLEKAENEMNTAVKEVYTRKHHYEENENITRYWTRG